MRSISAFPGLRDKVVGLRKYVENASDEKAYHRGTIRNHHVAILRSIVDVGPQLNRMPGASCGPTHAVRPHGAKGSDA
jgi:hypothetical protein